jgi:HEPN domain-containing protein
MSGNELKLRDTKSWIARAALDIAAAKHNLSANPALLEDSMFHCQQAVEKSLKAILVWHDIAHPRSHDIAQLAGLCRQIAPELIPLIESAAYLSAFALSYRYPSDVEPPSLTRAQVDDSISIASQIYHRALKLLPE